MNDSLIKISHWQTAKSISKHLYHIVGSRTILYCSGYAILFKEANYWYLVVCFSQALRALTNEDDSNDDYDILL